MKYWFVKSPFKTRKWEDVLSKGAFMLYGVRNHQARKNISKMKPGDLAVWYSSTQGKAIRGIMKVKCEAYQDPGTSKDWLAIDFVPVETFKKPVSLADLKENGLGDSNFVKQPRLTVVEISKGEYEKILNVNDNKSI